MSLVVPAQLFEGLTQKASDLGFLIGRNARRAQSRSKKPGCLLELRLPERLLAQ
jgi:hypothetical protein